VTLSLQALRSHASRWVLDRPYDPEEELRRCERLGARILCPEDSLYPELLRLIPDPPPVLYALGRLPLQGPAIALVGSRKPTPYGRRTARRLAAECASAGLVVVSGLARGVDTEAHEAAVGAGGRAWAVFGSGLDRVYPEDNAQLAAKIIACGGTLLSEVPLGGAPAARHFPLRNRLIAGLSWGTIVVEGDLRSGSLITARRALEQGRDVFAVPGPIDSPMSAGPNDLIAQGAKPVRTISDVIGGIGPLAVTAGGGGSGAPDEEKILELLGGHTLDLEQLLSETGWEIGRLMRTLAEMETHRQIGLVPGQRYART